MKIWTAILLLLLTACATGHKVQEQQRERVVTQEVVGAEWRDSLRITFHDVVIMPEDSPRVKVKIAKVELERNAESKVDSTIDQTVETEIARAETPAEGSGKWKYLLLAFCLWMLFARWSQATS